MATGRRGRRGERDRRRVEPVRLGGGPGAAPNRRNLYGYLFSLPLILFLAFVVYPLYFVVTQAVDPYTYEVLFADPVFVQTIVNTVVYVGVAVNLKLFLALLLSGSSRPTAAARGSSRRSSSCRGRSRPARHPVDPLDALVPVGNHEPHHGGPRLRAGPLAGLAVDGDRRADRLPHLEVPALLDRHPARGPARIPREIYEAASIDGPVGSSGSRRSPSRC